MGKSTDHTSKVALQFGTNPQAIGQEGHHARQVGQQVGVNGDGESRASFLSSLDGPHDVGLRPAFLPDEQGVAFAGPPGLEFPNVGAAVEVDQPVTVGFTVPHERVVALAERVSVAEVAGCADEGPELVGRAGKHLCGADGRGRGVVLHVRNTGNLPLEPVFTRSSK